MTEHSFLFLIHALEASSTYHYTPSSTVCSRTTRLHLANSQAFLSGLPWCTSLTILDVVVVDAEIDHNSGDSLSKTDNISHKINEAMDIDSLISGSCKKCKTTVGAVRIISMSEEEGSSAQLECRSKRREDTVGPNAAVAGSSNILPTKCVEDTHPVVSNVSLPVPTVKKVLFGSDRGSFPWREDLNVHEYLYNPANVAQGWRAFVPEAAREENDVITKQNWDLTECLAIVEIKIEGLAYEVATESWEFSTLANYVGGCSLYPASLSRTVGSFALTNYVGSCSFYPVILSMIAGSFALTNCVGDYDFNPVSLNMTVGSFALANCVGGYDFSLASLNMTPGSFALTNCVRGCSFYLASLNMT
ncbi:hypothetical protein GOBAR_AA15606 [Gossypium barbadense]|uniref:Uncharacterized protein n=1 Tax=Gossypium barbadense TaxID=3634 RepID=A0A2P5XNW9_GOSBA|nr:hypothetical protein GOBAR_AA15606 [Gossypium barbadense]